MARDPHWFFISVFLGEEVLWQTGTKVAPIPFTNQCGCQSNHCEPSKVVSGLQGLQGWPTARDSG